MYDTKNHGKYKNEIILRWRIELAQFDFWLRERTAQNNFPLDALSRAMHKSMLREVHNSLCHPGTTRMCYLSAL